MGLRSTAHRTRPSLPAEYRDFGELRFSSFSALSGRCGRHFRERSVTPPSCVGILRDAVEFFAIEQTSAHDDGRNPACVANVIERVGLEEHEVGALTWSDGPGP